MAEPAPTRRSSRHWTADSATPSGLEASTSQVAPVLSRRELRERQRATAESTAPVDADSLVEDVAQQVSVVAGFVAEAATQAQDAPIDEPVSAESVSDELVGDEPKAVEVDPFIAATRAFGITESVSVPRRASIFDAAGDAPSSAWQSLPEEATAVHVAPRRGAAFRRKALAVGATVGVMGIAGLLAVSMTLPAEAVAAAQGAQPSSATSLIASSPATASTVDDDEIQAFVASSDVQNDLIERSESFSTESLIDLAAAQGIRYSNTVYTNDPDASIQWPFVVGVGMSSPYGMRDTGMHEGIDLVPGAGAPVQVIADGTVRIATESGGNYGVTVYVDHVIDGKLITSHYSHMQYGSLRVTAGEVVHVGDIVGLVGNTGRSYGAHMHFELIVNGSTIDPLPWMNKNAGRYDGVTSPDAEGDTSE